MVQGWENATRSGNTELCLLCGSSTSRWLSVLPPRPVESHVSTPPANCLTPFHSGPRALSAVLGAAKAEALRRMSVSSKYRLRSFQCPSWRKPSVVGAKRGRRDPVSFTMNLLCSRRSLPRQVVGQASRRSILNLPCHHMWQGIVGCWLPCRSAVWLGILPLKAMWSGWSEKLYSTPRSAKPKLQRGDGTEMPYGP